MGQFSSSLNNPYVIETYSNEDGDWYRLYSDGWLEQGGSIGMTSGGTSKTLLKPYKDENFTLVGFNKAFSVNVRTYFSINSPRQITGVFASGGGAEAWFYACGWGA